MLGISLDTMKPMLKKHMEKENIQSILVIKNGDDFEIKNYSINVLDSINNLKKEYDDMKEKIKINSDLSETLEIILSSRKADSTKLKEIKKILEANK